MSMHVRQITGNITLKQSGNTKDSRLHLESRDKLGGLEDPYMNGIQKRTNNGTK